MDQLVSSGMDRKTAEALSKFVGKAIDEAVDKAVDKALRSSGFAARFQPQDAAQNPASKTGIVLTGITAFAAMASVQLGAVYWLNDSIRNDMQAGFASVHEEFGRVHDEIGEFRTEIIKFRTEVVELSELVVSIEIMIEDRLPSAP